MRRVIRERIMEELQERHHMDDGELLEMIDRAIGEMGQERYLWRKTEGWNCGTGILRSRNSWRISYNRL